MDNNILKYNIRSPFPQEEIYKNINQKLNKNVLGNPVEPGGLGPDFIGGVKVRLELVRSSQSSLLLL